MASREPTTEEAKKIYTDIVNRMNQIRDTRLDLNADPLEVGKLLVTGNADADVQFVAGVLLLTGHRVMSQIANHPEMLKQLMHEGIALAGTLQLEYQEEVRN